MCVGLQYGVQQYNMMFSIVVWLIIGNLCGRITGYCLYGDDSDCAFKCHCAVDSECDGGICPSGCDGAPLGYNWRGPACQIGNVGLHKSANMTVKGWYKDKYPAKAALDGVSPGAISSSCAHTSGDKPAEWWTDLGDVYKIYNITIYGRTDGSQERLQQFDLTVYNTSDNEILCGYHHDIINTYSTITCTRPVIGRYVHFKRKGGPNITMTALCEVVIIGHKYIDCSHCPVGVTCNDVIGCTQCHGSYPPDCKQKCESGYYGSNCQQQCGHCKDGVTCDNQNGRCHNGCQLWWINDTCQIYIEKPNGTKNTISVKNKTKNSIEIEWQHLTGINETLKEYYGYLIQYKDDTTDGSYIEDVRVNYTSSSSHWKIENLKYNTNYSIEIKPFRMFDNNKDYGSPYPVLHVKTKCDEPESPQNLNIQLVSDMDNLPKIFVTWQHLDNKQAHCDHLTNMSLLYKLETESIFKVIDLHVRYINYTINITREGKYDIKLVVWNNEGINSSSNIKYIEVTEKGREEKKSNFDYVPVIAGVIAALALIIIVIVIVVIWKRRKTERNTTRREYDNQTFHLENEDSPPIVKPYHANSQVSQDDVPAENDKDLNKVKEESDGDAVTDFTYEPDTEESLYANSAVAVSSFEGYVARKMARTNELSDEYKLFPPPDLSRCIMALTADNKQKNRYRNIYAYDDTRVILDGEEKNSYINATYITGYNKKKEYIATQGTKDTTLVDFWRLLWQEKANRIVMVTNVKEKGKQKIDPYWPHDVGDSLTLDDFKIKTEALYRSVDYITRIMSVSRGGDYRTVHQLHFTTWEDKKRPIHGSHTILAFLNRVHSLDKFSEGPLIVHCSAGVGRTGTFIALDILQQMAIKQKSVDIFNCVQRLRNERMLMVQTLDQYIFLHEAMVEFIKSGQTGMDYGEFQATFANILQSDPGTQVMTRIKKELLSLNELKKSTSNPRRDGLKPENVNKNRNKDVIPDDSHRLFLSRGKGGNYINAVFTDSFQARNTYVVTQMPLPHTILDFWQLILENEIQAIVMLNEMDPEDKTCLPYWPESVNTKEIYGRAEVELMSVKEQDFIVIRELKVTELTMKKLSKPEAVMIRQFQLLSWPQANDLPPDRGHLLTLLERLQIWQQKKQVADVKMKILVHCIDGCSRSGIFCGASFMLDKMKVEQELDAFLAVRYVTRNRPQFFTKLHEYKFLYQMAMEYLKGHTDYYNLH